LCRPPTSIRMRACKCMGHSSAACESAAWAHPTPTKRGCRAERPPAGRQAQCRRGSDASIATQTLGTPCRLRQRCRRPLPLRHATRSYFPDSDLDVALVGGVEYMPRRGQEDVLRRSGRAAAHPFAPPASASLTIMTAVHWPASTGCIAWRSSRANGIALSCSGLPALCAGWPTCWSGEWWSLAGCAQRVQAAPPALLAATAATRLAGTVACLLSLAWHPSTPPPP
jgi:hypothetical protein